DRISHTTVRRILLNKGEKKSRKQYAPTSVPKELHPTVKLLVDSLYEEENTRTTEEIVQIIKEKKYRAIGSREPSQVKPDVVANMREEISLRQFRVRYGHAVRLVNQLIRMIYCEKKIQEGEQFLTHVFTDESYIQLGKNSRTCFVKHRHQSIKPAPKHVQKLLIWGGISVRGPSPIMILRGKDSIVDSGKYQMILHTKYLQWSRYQLFDK
ncbi:hypothetical protein PRIPAC_86178, partial [Pristionchus pacificus]|uniref:Uncharacterized protein n=1 Tax=Pristionchus pacificus TaxID=54126 RepID=A0A2A6BVL4_PRIPA